MDIATVIGTIGASCILIAFIMNIFKRWTVEASAYLWINLFGSLLLVVYALLLRSAPFLLLNIVWTVVAVWGLFHHTKKGQ